MPFLKFLLQAEPIECQMGDVPKHRFENTVSFHHTDLDDFGPMFIKDKKYRNRRRIKVYGCVFICMST